MTLSDGAGPWAQCPGVLASGDIEMKFSSCTSLCPGEVEPRGEEGSPPLSETLANSPGKTGERSLAVLDPVSTAGVLVPVPGWEPSLEAGCTQTPLKFL